MGALIIKHKTSLSDEETIGAIQEIIHLKPFINL